MNLISSNQLSDFDSIFDNFFTGTPIALGKNNAADPFNRLRVDIHENDTQFEIVADLPGVKKDDVSIILTNNILTISTSANVKTAARDEGNFILRERTIGAYSRSFRVSQRIKQDSIRANFVDGVLSLSIPKLTAEDSEPDVRNITIN